MTYLCQPEYEKQVGETTITDYRFCYRADFDFVHCKIDDHKTFWYGLKAVKPSRIDTSFLEQPIAASRDTP